jgi:hypothetical protein
MSGVFQNIDPHHLWCGGRTHSLGGKGVGGLYFGRRQTLLCTLYFVNGTQEIVRRPLPLRGHRDQKFPYYYSLALCVYICYITAAANSLSLQLGSRCQGSRYGTARQTVRTGQHNTNHTCRVTVSQLS